MKNLIPTQYYTIKRQKVETVSARKLHAFLEVKTEFRKWITNCIQELGFKEESDFIQTKTLTNRRGGVLKDYALTLNAAKHISICEPNLKGKQIRKYFLECEKKAKTQIDYSNPETLEEFLKHLRKQIKHNENTITKNGVQHA